MLWILVGLGVLTAGLIVWSVLLHIRDDLTVVGMILVFPAGAAAIALIVMSFAWPVEYVSTQATLATAPVIQETLDRARASGLKEEQFAAQADVRGFNVWLARARWWNDSFFGDMVPDEVDTTPYLDSGESK